MNLSSTPYDDLTPSLIFEALENQSYIPTGVFYSLNSYENRVYEVQVEDQENVVVKFYRPGRWSLEAITEEHLFVNALAELEIPVVQAHVLDKPLNATCKSLGEIEGFYYAIYPKFRGRENPDLNFEEREWLGRSLARIHNVGASFKAKHRLELNVETYGYSNLEFILKQNFIPTELKKSLEYFLSQALELCAGFLNATGKTIYVHGDCHLGNVLWNHKGPYLLDFDDFLKAPAIQDFWMLFYGNEEEKQAQKEAFLKGYEVFREFNEAEFLLVEPLRTLRLIRQSAWVGQRYHETIFQKAFSYYSERRYWEEFLQNIKEQISLLQGLV